MSSARFRRLYLSVHNWVGLLVAVQFLFWCVGGVVMTVIPLALVRGEVNIAHQPAPAVSGAELVDMLEQIEIDGVSNVTVKNIAGRTAVVVESIDGSKRLYDGKTAALLSPVDEALARQIAVSDYRSPEAASPEVAIISSALLHDEPGDFRHALPVWQVTLDDPDGTRIYVSPQTGDVLARRNDYWRFYDFFWMLHIMDYETRDDFNNPLVITAAITSTLFVLTGFILLYFRFWPRKKPGLKKHSNNNQV